MAYRFGEFVYDASNRTLHRGDAEVALTPKTRNLLGLFLKNPSRLLLRQEIVDRLWPDVAVSDDALRFQVAELRKALGDESESFIKTIPREGYRWQAPVRSGASVAPSELSFRLVLENREVELEEGENILGRDRDAAVWIDHTMLASCGRARRRSWRISGARTARIFAGSG
jgi:DNA-binding winged helix-turn-helix (wHTH) protein